MVPDPGWGGLRRRGRDAILRHSSIPCRSLGAPLDYGRMAEVVKGPAGLYP